MRVLVLAPFDLFPPVHGGSSVVYNFVKHASARHTIAAVISRLYSQHGPQDLFADNLKVIYCPPSPVDRLRVLSFVVNPAYYRTASHACQEIRPQVIQSEILWTWPAAWRLRRQYHIPAVWVAHNIEALKYAEMGYPRWLVALVNRLERFACQTADHIITLSQSDRQQLVSMYQVDPGKVTVITPGPDLSVFSFDATARDGIRARYGLAPDDPLLSFVGNLKYGPNREAAANIVERIAPAVLRQHPGAHFVIVGQGSEELNTQGGSHITFTGYVSRSDLVAHLCATDVFLAPIEKGSGIRVKIPEATACGRAVITTDKGAEGLEAFTSDELVRVEGAGEEYVAAVLRLLADSRLRETLGARALARTRQSFGWQANLDLYEEAYAAAGASA